MSSSQPGAGHLSQSLRFKQKYLWRSNSRRQKLSKEVHLSSSNIAQNHGIAPSNLPNDAGAFSLSLWERAWTVLSSNEADSKYLKVLEKNFAALDHRRTIARDIADLLEAKQAAMRDKDGISESRTRRFVTRSARLMASSKDLVMGLSRLDPHGVAPLVLGGIFTVVQIVQNDSDERRTALALTLDISQSIALWSSVEKYQVLKNCNPRLRDLYEELANAIVELYQHIVIFLGTMMTYFDKGRWAQFFASISPTHLDWTRKQTEFKTMEANCDKIKSRITLQRENDDRNSSILKWISSHDIRASYRAVLERTKMDDQYSDRCQWLINSREFQEWRTVGNHSVIWLNGTIGTGKTTLMARAIREMEGSIPVEVEALPLAIFFFQKATDASKELLSVQTCLQSLVRQLSWNHSTAEIALCAARKYQELKERHQEHSQMTIGECLDLLKALVSERESYIMIDGIDECKDAHQLIRQLATIRCHKTSQPEEFASLHLMLCGRSDLPVTDCFGDTVLIVANSERSATDQDFFIDNEIDSICKLQAGSLFCSPAEEYPKRLNAILKRQAGGLFRWTEIQLQKFSTLGYFRTKDQIEDELGGLEKRTTSPELSFEYKRLLLQLETYGKNKLRAMKMLRLISCSFHSVEALDLAEAINADENNTERAKLSPNDVRRILVGFTTEVSLDPRNSERRSIAFAHASVLEFLTDSLSNIEAFTISDRHFEAAMISFSRIRVMSRHLSNREGVPASFSESKVSGFLVYCCFAWPRHCALALRGSSDADPAFYERLSDFFLDGGYNAWNTWMLWFYGQLREGKFWDRNRFCNHLRLLEDTLTNETSGAPGFVIALYDLAPLLQRPAMRGLVDLQQKNVDGATLLSRLKYCTKDTRVYLLKQFNFSQAEYEEAVRCSLHASPANCIWYESRKRWFL